MESLQTNIEELDEWRNLEKNVPCGLYIIKAYDIIFHTLNTNECQEISSNFEEKVMQSLAVIMKVYTNNVQDMKKDIQLLDINLKDE